MPSPAREPYTGHFSLTLQHSNPLYCSTGIDSAGLRDGPTSRLLQPFAPILIAPCRARLDPQVKECSTVPSTAARTPLGPAEALCVFLVPKQPPQCGRPPYPGCPCRSAAQEIANSRQTQTGTAFEQGETHRPALSPLTCSGKFGD